MKNETPMEQDLNAQLAQEKPQVVEEPKIMKKEPVKKDSNTLVIVLTVILVIFLLGAVGFLSYTLGKDAGKKEAESNNAQQAAQSSTTSTLLVTTSTTTETTTSAEEDTEKYVLAYDYSDKNTLDAITELTQLLEIPILYFPGYNFTGNVKVTYHSSVKIEEIQPISPDNANWVEMEFTDTENNLSGIMGFYGAGGLCYDPVDIEKAYGNFSLCKTSEEYTNYNAISFSLSESEEESSAYQYTLIGGMSKKEAEELIDSAELIE